MVRFNLVKQAQAPRVDWARVAVAVLVGTPWTIILAWLWMHFTT